MKLSYRIGTFQVILMCIKTILATLQKTKGLKISRPKFSHVKKKFGPFSISSVFSSVANILIGKDDEYGKSANFTKMSDSVCKDLKTSHT